MTTPIELNKLLCSIVALACNRDERTVDSQTSLLDLDMDSLTLVSVLAQVEAVYGIELGPDDTMAMLEATTVSDLAERLRARMPGEVPARATTGRTPAA